MFIAFVCLAHIYVDLIVSATNVFVVFLSTINKHFLLLLFKIQICKFMYLFINSMLPESLMNIFTPNSGVHNYNTRQKYFPHVNTRRTNMVSKTFIHQGPKLWQELPFDIQNSKSLIIFNKIIKKYFINIY